MIFHKLCFHNNKILLIVQMNMYLCEKFLKLVVDNQWCSITYTYDQFLFPRSPKGEGGILFYLCPSKIFFVAFFSVTVDGRNLIYGHKRHRYTILWVAFLDPSHSYFLFADLVGLYTHWTYMHIFCHIFLSNYWCRNLVFGHKLHIGTPYRGKRFWTHQIPTSCLPT